MFLQTTDSFTFTASTKHVTSRSHCEFMIRVSYWRSDEDGEFTRGRRSRGLTSVSRRILDVLKETVRQINVNKTANYYILTWSFLKPVGFVFKSKQSVSTVLLMYNKNTNQTLNQVNQISIWGIIFHRFLSVYQIHSFIACSAVCLSTCAHLCEPTWLSWGRGFAADVTSSTFSFPADLY